METKAQKAMSGLATYILKPQIPIPEPNLNLFSGTGYMPMRYHQNGIHDRPSKSVRQKRKAQRLARRIQRKHK